MKYTLYLTGLFVGLGLLLPATGMAQGDPVDSRHSIGIGGHYLLTVGDIEKDDDFDEDAIGWLVSYQFALDDLLTLEANLEFDLDYGGSDETFYLPQAYVLFGDWIYVGAGIGFGYIDSEWLDDPVYMFRGGLDIPLGDTLHVDINANYRFMSSSVFDEIDEEDSDAITFGAVLRLDL